MTEEPAFRYGCVTKIISGGQTGADQAALAAGREIGVATGGWAPKGWRTDNGSQPGLAGYGMVEHTSANYRNRTIANVRDSDGTIWFGNPASPGGKCTLGAAKRLNKPTLINPQDLEEFRNWLGLHRINVLNVAGNRERTSPGIYDRVKSFLIEAFL